MRSIRLVRWIAVAILAVIIASFAFFFHVHVSATEEIKEPLIVGVPADRCPVFYLDSHTGEVDGIGVALMREVAQNAGYSSLELHPASIVSMDFRAGTLDTEKGHEIIERLNEGIDVLPGTKVQAIVLDYTTRRLYKYDFADYVYQYGLVVAVFLLITCIQLANMLRLRPYCNMHTA